MTNNGFLIAMDRRYNYLYLDMFHLQKTGIHFLNMEK